MLPSDDALPAPVPSPAPGFWRWLARAALALWWLFVVALAAGAASYAGNHSGPALISLLPRFLTWTRAEFLLIQAALALGALVLLSLMIWLTVLAWRQRQRQAVEQMQAGIERQTIAFEGALDRDVNPRLGAIQAGVEQAAALGETVAAQQETLLVVATETRDAVASLQQEKAAHDRRTEHASLTRRVFISSTFVDLHAYRARLHEALEGLYQLPVDMVNFGAGGGDATIVSTDEVAASDLFVLVVAWRYGVVPSGATKSITEQEYDEARRLGLPIFVFLADPATEAADGPDALFPAAVRNPEYAAQLAAFRTLLADPNRHTYAPFTTPDDLALKVQTALYRYLLRSGAIGADPSGPPFEQANLPLPEKTFVGRQADLDWLLPRLRAGGEAVITAIDGLGGVGKSTLAAVAVHRLAAQGVFPDGIAVVDCLGRADTIGVLRDALDGFAPKDAPEAADLAALATLAVRQLTGKRVLIVFDNVEPELEIAAVIQRLHPTGVAILLTARQRLPVPRDALRELALLSEDAALDLFAEWYGRPNAAALVPAERTAAARVVTALGRHTLAVKLAAAEAGDGVQHLDTPTPAAIAQWLAAFADEKAAHPLNIQGLDADVTLALKDTLMRSVQKLPTGGALGDVRLFFAALAVFVAPAAPDAPDAGDVTLVPSLEFGRQAASAIAIALELPDQQRAIALLVRRALLEQSTITALPEDADRGRLRLHPLLRELAAELLDDPTRAAASLAVARFYADYANATPDVALVPDAENIAGALEWAHVDAPDEDRDALVAGICDGMRQFWRDRSRTRDSLRYLPWGIEAAERRAASGERDDRLALARLQLADAEALITAGKLRDAEGLINHSLSIRRSVGDTREEGVALSKLGDILVQRGDLAGAQANYERARAIMGEVGDTREEGVALSKLGQLALAEERLNDAETYFRDCLAIMRDVGDALSEGRISQILGEFLIVRRDNRDEGCALIGSAVRIFHQMGVPDEDDARELAVRLGCDVEA